MQILGIIAAILIGLWLIAHLMHLAFTIIHILVVVAIIAVLIRVIQGRPVL